MAQVGESEEGGEHVRVRPGYQGPVCLLEPGAAA
jgi:hypothetical protein